MNANIISKTITCMFVFFYSKQIDLLHRADNDPCYVVNNVGVLIINGGNLFSKFLEKFNWLRKK
jgi:hypothetical protein